MSLFYCSLLGTASKWYDRHRQPYKNYWSSLLKSFKEQFYSQKHACHAQLEALLIIGKTLRMFDIML